jgi:hypothetical protein
MPALDGVRYEPGDRTRQGRALHGKGEVEAHDTTLPFMTGTSLRPQPVTSP